MQLYKGQTRAKPHGPALLQPDEPRTQSNPHNNYITMPRPGTATRRRCGGPRFDQSRIRLNAYRACARMRNDRFLSVLTRSDVVATAYVIPGPRFD